LPHFLKHDIGERKRSQQLNDGDVSAITVEILPQLLEHRAALTQVSNDFISNLQVKKTGYV
jgi:hypothetical protein